MDTELEFQPFPKLPRGQNETVTITEKMDGTNACIVIQDGKIIGVQSRKRFITPDDDNYGFAGWVERNREALEGMGDGHHYGEWAGLGIQKNPHNLDKKYFFLFNTARWNPKNPNLPEICRVVKVLYEGAFHADIIDGTMLKLRREATSNQYVAEGVVVWFHRGRRYEKHTFTYQTGKWTGKE